MIIIFSKHFKRQYQFKHSSNLLVAVIVKLIWLSQRLHDTLESFITQCITAKLNTKQKLTYKG